MENCNCNGNLRIGRGNDFTIEVELRHPTLKTVEDFDLTTCTDIECAIVSRLGKHTAVDFTITDDGKLRADFDENVPLGVYGFEVKGKDAEGHDWRFYARPGEWLEIVNASSDENDPEPNGKSYYEKDVTFGMITAANDMAAEMRAIITKNKESLAKLDSTIESCEKATKAAIDITAEGKSIVDEYNNKLKEHLVITLKGNNTDNPLDGLTVLVRSNEDNSVIYEFNWEGKPIETELPDDTHYNILTQYAKGYSKIMPRSFTAVGGNNRIVNFDYVWNGETIEDADVDISITEFFRLFYEDSMEDDKYYNIHHVNDGMKVISQWYGDKWISGYSLDELRSQPVEWGDENLKAAVLQANGNDMNYGELVDMPLTRYNSLSIAINKAIDDEGNYYREKIESIDELCLCRYVNQWGNYNYFKKLRSVDNKYVSVLNTNGLQNCTSLTSVNLPNVNSIGTGGLQNCTSLTSVNLPNATTIGTNALAGCTSLTSVNLPNATTIGTNALGNCSSLTELTLGSIPPSGTGSLLTDCIVYVPDDSVETYKQATGWNQYTIKPLSEKKNKR